LPDGPVTTRGASPGLPTGGRKAKSTGPPRVAQGKEIGPQDSRSGPPERVWRPGGTKEPRARRRPPLQGASAETSARRPGGLRGNSTGCGPHRTSQAQGRPKALSESSDLNN